VVQVYGILTDPTGRPLQRQRVIIRSVTPGNPFTILGSAVSRVATIDTDTDGRWDADLIPSDDYELTGQYYMVDWRDTARQTDALYGFTVPPTGGPTNFRDHLVEPLPPGTPIPPVTAHRLADHTDVDLTGLADGDVLTYVLADDKWEALPAGTGPGGGVADVTAADATIVIGGTTVHPTVRVNGAALTNVPQAAVTGLVAAIAAKYEKPGTGIPAADLAAAVQNLLTLAGTAVQPGSLATVALTGAYSDLTGRPILAAVATSGAYADLSGKPVLAAVATSGAYADLSGRPALAPVATSGVYADLTGKPTIPTTPGEVGAQPADADLTAIAALAPADGTVLRRIAGAWGAAALAKADVGLGNVDNTADTAKPVSTATATALAGKQDADADLTTIAGLAPADGAVLRRVAGVWAGATLTKSDVGLANVDNTADTAKPVSTAQQAALDGKQPLDSDLTAIAGLAPANGSWLRRAGGTWVADDGVVALTDQATITTDAAAGEVFTVTLAGNRTLAAPTNPRDAMKRTWRFRQDGTGGRTITLDAVFALGSNVPNTTLTGTAGKVGYLTAMYDSTAAKWHVLAFEPGA